MSILRSKTYLSDLRYTVENTSILSRLRDMSVLITGGTGLIGSSIVDLLLMANLVKKLNIKVFVAARNIAKAENRFSDFPDQDVLNYLEYINYDATKYNSFPLCTNYIIHAASNAHPRVFVENPVDTMLSNIDGLKELLIYAKNTVNIAVAPSRT